MSGIIGKKIGMTSIFDANGKAIPCTVIEAGPCVVSQVKTVERDGYSAVQLAYGERKVKNMNKAQQGHLKKVGKESASVFREFRYFVNEVSLGEQIDVNLFEIGDFVDVVANSKGKGFQGVVKRHGFSGVGGRTHGQHNRQRHPGSLGASSFPSRVFKGMRMAGQTGNTRVKALNLRILQVIPEKNLLVVSGCCPGSKGSIVTIEK